MYELVETLPYCRKIKDHLLKFSWLTELKVITGLKRLIYIIQIIGHEYITELLTQINVNDLCTKYSLLQCYSLMIMVVRNRVGDK